MAEAHFLESGRPPPVFSKVLIASVCARREGESSMLIAKSVFYFILAGLCEIGGGSLSGFGSAKEKASA
jgi:hypothetical protein